MQRFLWLTSVAVPSLMDLSEKVRMQSPVIITSSLMKSPTTRRGQTEIRSPDWGWTQRGALFNLTTWQTPRKKKRRTYFSVYNWKRKYACAKCKTLILCYFKFTRLKYLYIPLRSFPRDLITSRFSVFFYFFYQCAAFYSAHTSLVMTVRIQSKWSFLFFFPVMPAWNSCFPIFKPSFINA